MRIRPFAGVLLALVVLLALARQAEAGRDADPLAKPTDPEALRHLDRGDAHFRIQEFQEAIDEYRDGARIQASPRFLYNIAQAYRQLGQYDKAVWYFDQWIKVGRPPAEMRKAVEEVMQKMRDDMAEAARNQPPTAPAGDSGPADAGADAGRSAENGRAENPAVDKPSPNDSASAVLRANLPSSQPAPWYADGVGWGLTGGGVVLAGIGTGFLFNASGLEDDADHLQLPEPDREDLRAKAKTRRIIGAAFVATGAAATVTGVVKLVITPPAPAGSGRELALTFGSSWIGLEGRF